MFLGCPIGLGSILVFCFAVWFAWGLNLRCGLLGMCKVLFATLGL